MKFWFLHGAPSHYVTPYGKKVCERFHENCLVFRGCYQLSKYSHGRPIIHMGV